MDTLLVQQRATCGRLPCLQELGCISALLETSRERSLTDAGGQLSEAHWNEMLKEACLEAADVCCLNALIDAAELDEADEFLGARQKKDPD